MPALRLFGRKWLAASDDLVFPCLFEICFRIPWLILISIVLHSFFSTPNECSKGNLAVRIYLSSTVGLIILNIVLLVGLVNRSAQGSIAETHMRRLVAPLLVCKILLILPEIGLNVFGTIWAFSELVTCTDGLKFSKTVIEAIVIFNWIQFCLIIFGLAIVFDPLGSTKYRKTKDTNGNNGPTESALHRKLSNVWLRRFRWIFCCLRKDEYGNEAFTQVASLLSAIFRGTDLVPTDIMAGCILMRVRQKREHREMRRIRMLNNDGPRYSTDINRLFATTPSWMTIRNARHFMRFALASYGWPLVCYEHCCTGPFHLLKQSTCCGCFRSKARTVIDDNCCLCHHAGVKFNSKLRDEDILHASFKNHVFELPYCVLADHSRKCIVIAIRGSLSFRDIFTDLTAAAEKFESPGLPADTYAHRGMAAGADKLIAKLKDTNLLERAFNTYPEYSLVITGHSLGAGVGILLGLRLRAKYPDLKVYAFGTPAGLLSREAARYTESFVMTVAIGDDFVMRTSVESIENIRTGIIETIRACKLPKYRIMLNGFGYAIFGVPSRDLETTWRDVTEISAANNTKKSGESPLLGENRTIATITRQTENPILNGEFSTRRFSKIRLYNGGRILHIGRRKKTELEKKTKTGGPTYELRWASPEEFMEFRIMPRMLLDHFPDNMVKTLTTILDEQTTESDSIRTINEV